MILNDKRVTQAHLGPIWYHSNIPNIRIWFVFCYFLQQSGSRILVFFPKWLLLFSTKESNGSLSLNDSRSFTVLLPDQLFTIFGSTH